MTSNNVVYLNTINDCHIMIECSVINLKGYASRLLLVG
jgi:hypothetical protein